MLISSEEVKYDMAHKTNVKNEFPYISHIKNPTFDTLRIKG